MYYLIVEALLLVWNVVTSKGPYIFQEIKLEIELFVGSDVRLKSNLRKHMNIEEQIFQPWRIVKQL